MTLNCPTARLWRPPGRGSRHVRSGLQPRGLEGRRRLGGESRSQKTLTSPAPSGPVTVTGSLRDLELLRRGFAACVPTASFTSLSKACGDRTYTSRQYSNSGTGYYRDPGWIPGRACVKPRQGAMSNPQRAQGPTAAPTGAAWRGYSPVPAPWEAPSPARPGCARRVSRRCGTGGPPQS